VRDCLCDLVARVPGFRTEMYCVSCEVRTEFICHVEENRPPLVVRVPGCRTEIYYVSCEVRTEFMYVMQKKVGAHGSVMVKVLCYKPEGRRFDTR
jgi:hypothetical protein